MWCPNPATPAGSRRATRRGKSSTVGSSKAWAALSRFHSVPAAPPTTGGSRFTSEYISLTAPQYPLRLLQVCARVAITFDLSRFEKELLLLELTRIAATRSQISCAQSCDTRTTVTSVNQYKLQSNDQFHVASYCSVESELEFLDIDCKDITRYTSHVDVLKCIRYASVCIQRQLKPTHNKDTRAIALCLGLSDGREVVDEIK